jgi:hypothetical protein
VSASSRERGGCAMPRPARLRPALALALLVAVAAPAARAQQGPTGTPPAGFDAGRYRQFLAQVAARQRDLGARYTAARGGRARAAIRDEARRFVVDTLVAQIFPAWIGMPSAGGPQATASLPHQPGMYISCSYFLTAALQNAGLVLESRARFAQAPAAWIQRALLPPGGQIHRYGRLGPADLERRLVELGDGLYVVGLNIHVGFIVVKEGRAWFVHSSYTPPGTVVNEPVASSMAIALSQSKGYWVSPLFRDDRIVELWLRRQPVPAPPHWKGVWSETGS